MPNKELYHGCSYRNRNGWRKLTDYERGKKMYSANQPFLLENN